MTSHFCNFFCSQGCLLSSETMCSTAYRSTQNRQIETSYFQSNIIKLILEDSQFLSCEICVNCTEIIVVLCRFRNLSIAFKIVTAEVEWLPANQQYRKIHSSNKSIMQATFDFEQGGRSWGSAGAALPERSGSSTKGRTSNIRYFVAKPSIVAIYAFFERLSQGFQLKPSCSHRACFLRAFNKSNPSFVELSTKAILLS